MTSAFFLLKTNILNIYRATSQDITPSHGYSNENNSSIIIFDLY